MNVTEEREARSKSSQDPYAQVNGIQPPSLSFSRSSQISIALPLRMHRRAAASLLELGLRMVLGWGTLLQHCVNILHVAAS